MAPKAFKAKLEHSGVPGTWSTVRIPFDVEKLFGSRARVAVKGTVNGVPFRGSAMPVGDGSHFLVVNKTLQKEAGASPGDTLEISLEPDTQERTVEVPEELQAALKKNTAARRAFEALSYSHRREYADFVREAKRPETRLARAAKSVVMLTEGKRLKG
ncbi:YdeI/OmpD-associated family protein [Vitiosangium sp. GDMCC 1.1324]|uniref:YdeI/OmpD-associated family protein n=1 Tax=Vitiosangium sp. (strain GDMCC 1.1324) TaxID=2138576 RepID=UPI00130E599D|nr:YdeI/OmpD-associated family protein [Vitiosangium sp. GDMCC 1.1324]